MNPTHDWHVDTYSMELLISRDEADSVSVRLGHDNIDDAHGTTIITSRLIEMIDTVQPGAIRAYLTQQEPSDAEVEAAARKVFETDAPSHEPHEWFDASEALRADYRSTARAALRAARNARGGAA